MDGKRKRGGEVVGGIGMGELGVAKGRKERRKAEDKGMDMRIVGDRVSVLDKEEGGAREIERLGEGGGVAERRGGAEG